MPISASTAFLASGPTARTVTCWPLLAPSCMTARTLFASAWPPATASCTAEENRAAATDSAPAGRACRSPVSVMVASQFSGMACLLRGLQDSLEAAARGGRGYRRRTLNERGIRDRYLARQVARIVGEQRAHGQHRAAQVGQDHHSGPRVRAPDRRRDLVDAGTEAAVVGPASGGDGHRPATDLASEFRRALSERGAV